MKYLVSWTSQNYILVMAYPAIFVYQSDIKHSLSSFSRRSTDSDVIEERAGVHFKGLVSTFAGNVSFSDITRRSSSYQSKPAATNRRHHEVSERLMQMTKHFFF